MIFPAAAQTTSTADGKWIDGTTWGGTSPGYTSLGDITINSYVVSDAGLNFNGNNKSLIISDTLIVYGDVTFVNSTSGATVSVGANNVLIIFGDLDMGRNHAGIDIGAGGMVIVTGNVLADPSGGGAAIGDVTGTGTLYTTDGSSTSGFNVANSGGEQPTSQISETGGSQAIEDFVTGGGASPLPVEFLFFQSSTADYVKLTWATASEKDNDRFEVERSDDGEFFYSIGDVQGSGTVNERVDYSFVDFSAIASVSYYRLKQVDFDGVYEYSQTIRVETGVSSSQVSFQVYPTVVTNDFMTINANRSFEVKNIEVFGLSGNQQGKEVNFYKNHPSEIEISGNNLQKGIYLIRLTTTEGDLLVQRFIVR